MQRLEDAIYSDTYKNAKGEHYSDLMDVNSFVDYFLVQFFSNNMDAFHNSTYMCKERGGKIAWGPVWDFDHSMDDLEKVEDNTVISGTSRYMVKQLVSDPQMAGKILTRYEQIRPLLTNLYENGGYVDKTVAQIGISAQNDLNKWNTITPRHYDEEIATFKAWIKARIDYMDWYLPELAKDCKKLTFDYVNGQNLSSIYVVTGSAITMPEEPKREGYLFCGWYYNENGQEKQFTKDTIITKELHLVAKWTRPQKASHTITLVATGGTIKGTGADVKDSWSVTTTEDTPLHLQVSATRKGYLFTGWYDRETGGTQMLSYGTLQLQEDMTYYAHWSKVTVKKGKLSSLKKKGKTKLHVKFAKLSGAKGYELLYATNKNMKNASRKNLAATSCSFKVSKKHTYYLKVRAYKYDSTGKKVYGKYSSVKKIKM